MIPFQTKEITMSKSNLILRGLSMLGGLGLVATVAYLNASDAAHATSWSSPTVIAIVALALGSALAVPVAQDLYASRRYALVALACLGIVAGESFGFFTSAERLLNARQERVLEVRAANATRGAAQAAVTRAADELAKAAADVAAETGKGGCGKVCRDLQKEEAAARDRLARAEADLAKAPQARSESLVADVTGWSAAAVEVLPALAFPTALLVLGFSLIGYAHAPADTRSARLPSGASPAMTAVTEATTPLPAPVKPGTKHEVVDWVRAYRARHGRSPQIPEVQARFALPKTTAWRRINEA